MPFDARLNSLVNIAPCGCESIVKTLPGYLGELWRWWWLDIYRSWMRTSSQSDGQQQHRHSKPFLHIMPSILGFDFPPEMRLCDAPEY